MNRRRQLAAVVLGLTATAAAVFLAVQQVEPAAPDADPGGVAWLIGLAGLAAAAWLFYDRTRSRSTDDPIAWADAGPIVEDGPEDVTRTHPLSGGDLAAALVDAGVAARERREIETGMTVVRPLLRETYLEAMTASGRNREGAEADLDAGTWTDDPVAAAALSAAVEPPSRSLRRRIADWLYPGRAVVRRTVRGVDALTVAVDEALSPVVGSHSPRQVPVYEPSLAVREVGADGRVRDRGQEPNDADGSVDANESVDTEDAPDGNDADASPERPDGAEARSP